MRTERAQSPKTMFEATIKATISKKSAELPCHPSAKTLRLVSRLWQAVAGGRRVGRGLTGTQFIFLSSVKL